MFIARGFACALFMIGRGLRPLSAEKQENGRVDYYFDDTARLHLSDFVAAKDVVTQFNERAAREATA